jgi:hypothetical protein
VTFGFVGDRGSFLSQCQRDLRLRNLFLTVRLTALRSRKVRIPVGRIHPVDLQGHGIRRPQIKNRIGQVEPRRAAEARQSGSGTGVTRGYLIKELIQAGLEGRALLPLPPSMRGSIRDFGASKAGKAALRQARNDAEAALNAGPAAPKAGKSGA